MPIIRDTFDPGKNIDRRIEKVISYAADDDQRLKTEVSEYVVTESIEASFETVLERMNEAMADGGINDTGVWVSGFYGSGKSSFTKYLGFGLDPERKIEGRRFVDVLLEQFSSPQVTALFNRAISQFPAVVIHVDLGADQIAGATLKEISTVLYLKSLAYVGYSSADMKVALLEKELDRRGKYDEFKEAVKQKNYDWKEIQNNALVANAIAAQLAPKLLEDLYPNEAAFQAQSMSDLIVDEKTRVQEMIQLLQEKSGRDNIIFVLDEVGQYIASRNQLILNLDGLARNIKELGQSKVWIMGTAQQTLTEDNPRAHINSPDLYKLSARFPLQIDLEASDIKEICIKRLLGKSAEGKDSVGNLFDQHGPKLRQNTKIVGSRFYDSEYGKDSFCDLYPFLPHHFDVLLSLLGRLAKTSGGIGLRSAIKIVQDVLTDPTHLPSGSLVLADQEVGNLVNAVILYDALRRDIERSFRHLVSAVDRAVASFGANSMEAKAAKAVAILQVIQDLPASLENISALLHPSIAEDSQFDITKEAIDNLEREQAIPLSFKDQQYKFLSDAIIEVQEESRNIVVRDAERRRTFNGQLVNLFTPSPSASVADTKRINSGLKVKDGEQIRTLEGEKHAVQYVVSLVDSQVYDTNLDHITDESTERANANHIYLVAKKPPTIDDDIEEACRSESAHRKYRDHAEPDVRDYAEAQSQRQAKLLNETKAQIQSVLEEGSFVFQGQRTTVAQLGNSLASACSAQLGHVAKDIYSKYSQASIQAPTNLAEKFLRAGLAGVTSETDPLGFVEEVGGRKQIKETADAIRSITDHLERHHELEGKRLLGNFADPEFGWSKDTARYVLAAMFLGGLLKLKIGGDEVTAVGDTSINAFKSNVTFGRVGVSLRDSRPDPESLVRAANRIGELIGEDVLLLEQDISKAFTDHFPDLQSGFSSIQTQLAQLGLAGAERVENINRQIGDSLRGDGSNVPALFGAEQCSLHDDITWANEVKRALNDDFIGTVEELKKFKEEINRLSDTEQISEIKSDASEALQVVDTILKSEDFYRQAAELKQQHHKLEETVQAGVKSFSDYQTQSNSDNRDSIQNNSGWAKLDEDYRESINQRIEKLKVEPKPNLDGLIQLTQFETERLAQINTIRNEVEAKIKATEEERRQAGAVSISLPSRFEEAEQVDQIIDQVQKIKDQLPADVDWKH